MHLKVPRLPFLNLNFEITQSGDYENQTWTQMAALVCFLNLKSFRAVIALNPVCNVIADNRTLK